VDIVDIVYNNIFYLPYLCLVVIYTFITLYYKYIHLMCLLNTKINPIQFFSIFNMKGIVIQFVATCCVFQCNKYQASSPAWLLQPFPIAFDDLNVLFCSCIL